MKRFKEIPIGLEVAKAIENDRQSFDETEDDILRRKYKLPPASRSYVAEASGNRPLVCKGGSIPHGTKLRARYKGRSWNAKVENGRIYLEGDLQPYHSPTDAAVSITKGNVNGWRFWQHETPAGKWEILSMIRARSREAGRVPA